MPERARMLTMSALVRASCFGVGAGGAGVDSAGVEGTDGVGVGVDELGIEGVDGVGVAEGVCNRRHWLGCRRDCRGERWGFALHEALWRRVAGVSEACVVQFPRLVVVGSRRGVSESRIS